MSDASAIPPGFRWGYVSVALGALGLVLAMVHIFGGPFTPQPSIGTTIGDIAGDMRAAVLRAVRGEPQPAPQPVGWDIDRVLLLAAPLLGAAALVMAVVSAIARDGWRLPTYGAVLGLAAIVFQLFWWVAVLFAGAILLVAIIENLGEILGG